LPTVAAGIRAGTDIARAGNEATTETRTGDSPDVFVNRTINALYDTYGDADKIPLAMLEKYKRRAKEMIDNNMFQWTPAERDQAFATLDKWALQFRQTKDTERRMKEEDEKQYQRDLARDKARSSGGGGIPETMEKILYDVPGVGPKYITVGQYLDITGQGGGKGKAPSKLSQAFYDYGSGQRDEVKLGFESVQLGKRTVEDKYGKRVEDVTLQSWLDNKYFTQPEYKGKGTLIKKLSQRAALEINNAAKRGEIKENQMIQQYQQRVKEMVAWAEGEDWNVEDVVNNF